MSEKAERENALILRVYNSSGNTVANGKLKLGKMFNHVELANLNEQTDSEKELVGMDGEWSLPQIKSNQILSLKLKINDDQTAV
jgi:alpha-mannosidase